MTPDRWQQVDKLYHGALELNSRDRDTFLAAACAADADLRQEVESLLNYESAAESFLEQPALHDAARQVARESESPDPGPEVDGYTIVKVLGEGGMGVVYLAEQTQPVRRAVALKVIRHGMDTRRIVARFEAERQALAMMRHPHIAAILDAGTSNDGRPYVAMEYVEGLPVTAYCDRHRLPTRERLSLFGAVCAAVQHAHQRGIIHRDLKPSNILVCEQDGQAVPKIIDFGIAKAIESTAGKRVTSTESGTIVGTPEYMSPEQAAQSPDIDTTTDVYSLGVVLYELLVGALPFDASRLRTAGLDEMRRLIRESDPPRPSTRLTREPAAASIAAARRNDPARLSRHLKGDLDWITLKALEKDRRRRYPTVAGFAADLARYLADEPVEARPPSTVYRMTKFARRHRTGVAAAAAVVIALVAGLTVSVNYYWRAESQRAEADRQRAQSDAARAEAIAASTEADRQRRNALSESNRAESLRAEAERQTREAQQARVDAESAASIAAEQRNNALAATDRADRLLAETQRQAHDAELARNHAEALAYEATIAAAANDLRAHLPSQARARLLTVAPALRQWEWRHLFLATDTSTATLESGVKCLPPTGNPPFDPSDDAVALLDGDSRIALRRCSALETWSGGGYAPHTYTLPGRPLTTTSSGSVATVEPERTSEGTRWSVFVVNPSTQVSSLRLGPFNTEPICMAVSHNGQQAAIGFRPDYNAIGEPQKDEFEIWDASGGHLRRLSPKKLDAFDTRAPFATTCMVRFSPDDASVATSGANVHVWLTASGSELANDSAMAGYVSQPIAFSPDGSSLAIGRPSGLIDIMPLSDGDPLVRLDANGLIQPLPLTDGERRVLIPRRRLDEVMAIAFSPDGALAVSGTGNGLYVWDVAARRCIRSLTGHDAVIDGIAISHDGRIVSSDRSGKIRVWPLRKSGAITTLPGTAPVANSVAVSPDGRFVGVAQTDGKLSLWHLDEIAERVVKTGTGSLNIAGIARSLSFEPGTGRLLSAEYDDAATIRWWDTKAGTTAALATQSVVEPGCERTGQNQFGAVDVMAESPDRRFIAFSQNACVVVRDLKDLRTVAVLQESPSSLIFRDDGLLLMSTRTIAANGASTSSTIRVWDYRNHRTLSEHQVAGDVEVFTSGDGGRVGWIEGNVDQRTIAIWDRNLTSEIGRLRVQEDTKTMAFSADGHRIATRTSDTAIRIWDADRLTLLLVLTDTDQHSGRLAFTPDGRLVAARASGGLTIWESIRRD